MSRNGIPSLYFCHEIKSKNKSHVIRINPIVEITEEDAEKAVKELRSEIIKILNYK